MTKISNFTSLGEKDLGLAIGRLKGTWDKPFDYIQYKAELDFLDAYVPSLKKDDVSQSKAMREYQLLFEQRDYKHLSPILSFIDDLITEHNKLDIKAAKTAIEAKASNSTEPNRVESLKNRVDKIIHSLLGLIKNAFEHAKLSQSDSTMPGKAEYFNDLIKTENLELENKDELIEALSKSRYRGFELSGPGTDKVTRISDRCLTMLDQLELKSLEEPDLDSIPQPAMDVNEAGVWNNDQGRAGIVGTLSFSDKQNAFGLSTKVQGSTLKLFIPIRAQALIKLAVAYGTDPNNLVGKEFVGEFAQLVGVSDTDEDISFSDNVIDDILAPDEWQATGATELKLQS